MILVFVFVFVCLCVCVCFSVSDTTRQAFWYKHVEFSLVFIGSSQVVEQVYVSGEGQAFFEGDCDLVKALVNLISACYVFDVRYAQFISSVLHFKFCKRWFFTFRKSAA